MDAAGDKDNGLAAPDQVACFPISKPGLTELTRVSQQPLDLFIFRETNEILGRTNGSHDKWSIHRGFPERLKHHPITRAVERLKICDDLIPARQLTIIAGDESENVCGRRQRAALGHRNLSRAGLSKRIELEERRGGKKSD